MLYRVGLNRCQGIASICILAAPYPKVRSSNVDKALRLILIKILLHGDQSVNQALIYSCDFSAALQDRRTYKGLFAMMTILNLFFTLLPASQRLMSVTPDEAAALIADYVVE